MPPTLSRSEQNVTLALLLAGVGGITAFAWHLGVSKSRLIDVDEATKFGNSFAVDLNAATVEELAVLPGLGPTLAREIVDYRLANGPFQRPEDLLQVPGIGPQKLEAIRGYLAPTSERFFDPLHRER